MFNGRNSEQHLIHCLTPKKNRLVASWLASSFQRRDRSRDAPRKAGAGLWTDARRALGKGWCGPVDSHVADSARGGSANADPSRQAICGHCLKVGTFSMGGSGGSGQNVPRFYHRCLHNHCRKTPVAQREDGDTWRFQCSQHKCPEKKRRQHNRAVCIPCQDLPSDIREELGL